MLVWFFLGTPLVAVLAFVSVALCRRVPNWLTAVYFFLAFASFFVNAVGGVYRAFRYANDSHLVDCNGNLISPQLHQFLSRQAVEFIALAIIFTFLDGVAWILAAMTLQASRLRRQQEREGSRRGGEEEEEEEEGKEGEEEKVDFFDDLHPNDRDNAL